MLSDYDGWWSDNFGDGSPGLDGDGHGNGRGLGADDLPNGEDEYDFDFGKNEPRLLVIRLFYDHVDYTVGMMTRYSRKNLGA